MTVFKALVFCTTQTLFVACTMVDKRGPEPVGDGAPPQPKRSKFEPAPTAGLARPGLSLEALEKAKQVLQKQKELQEKLKKLPQLQRPAAIPGTAPFGPGAVLPASTVAAAAAAIAKAAGGAAPAPGSNPVLAAAAQKAAEIAASFGAGTSGAAPLLPHMLGVPLRLDSQGREIDAQGNLVVNAMQPVTTLKINQQVQMAAQKARDHSAAKTHAPQLPILAPEPVEASPFVDSRMGNRALKKLSRRKKASFDFVQEGTFQKQAEIGRIKAKYGDDALKKMTIKTIGPARLDDANQVPIGGGDPNKIPLGVKLGTIVIEIPEEVPDIEPWDRKLLLNGSYEADLLEDGKVAVKENKITIYVEHPVPIDPPAEAAPPPPQPLKLTARELKKLRTQRRLAREKEKQELIKQGLLEPPKPKVKLSNLHRVLGEQAAADPTAIEREVRKQMEERQQAHDDRNVARMLTPAERRDKKIRKMFDSSTTEVFAAVYRIRDLSNPQHRFKVDVNARENRLTGVVLITDDFTLVLVEGCAKSIKRYNKLMLRRIDWDTSLDEDSVLPDPDKPPNSCHLVWQGVVKKASFKDFRVEPSRSALVARKLLNDHKLGHYWDSVLHFNPEDAPIVPL